MTKRALTAARIAILLAITPAAYGCRTAAAVGAGAAAGAAAATTVNQNVESTVSSPIGTVERRTRQVLASMGMTLTDVEYEDAATERELEGRSGDNVAHVKLVADGTSRTRVAVSYRRGAVDYSKTEAQRILDQIRM